MAEKMTRRGLLRGAGLLGLGGLIWSAASRPGAAGRLPCERCPALTACTAVDSLQARDALGVRLVSPVRAGRLEGLCETDSGDARV